MNREYHKWCSPHLAREMELLVFGHGGRRMLVFPTRQQRFFEYEDCGMVQSLQKPLAAGELQLFCVDGIDEEALYGFDKSPDERVARMLDYERYIIEEVLPFAENLNPGTPLIAHGCSLGAYQAMTMALRHPAYFQRVLAFSGRFDLTQAVGEFYSLFEHFDGGETLRGLMPSLFVPTLANSKLLRKIRKQHFTLVMGEEDPFLPNNEALCAAFREKKIPCDLHVWFGNAHRFRYWRQMVRIYL